MDGKGEKSYFVCYSVAMKRAGADPINFLFTATTPALK
jgi:hypothetical protein